MSNRPTIYPEDNKTCVGIIALESAAESKYRYRLLDFNDAVLATGTIDSRRGIKLYVEEILPDGTTRNAWPYFNESNDEQTS